jgi:hypothetical protein
MRHNICVENLEDIQQAEVLYEEALDFVNKNVAVINQPPTVIFCATQSCFESFGFGYQKAATFGQLGIVVGPNGWKDFFIRHEMIHHLQNERWGSLRCRFFLPKWLVEGMAYSLSKDPRDDLAEPMRSQRIQFEGWLKNIDKEQLWNQY